MESPLLASEETKGPFAVIRAHEDCISLIGSGREWLAVGGLARPAGAGYPRGGCVLLTAAVGYATGIWGRPAAVLLRPVQPAGSRLLTRKRAAHTVAAVVGCSMGESTSLHQAALGSFAAVAQHYPLRMLSLDSTSVPPPAVERLRLLGVPPAASGRRRWPPPEPGHAAVRLNSVDAPHRRCRSQKRSGYPSASPCVSPAA
eukprot:scaffold567_cov384-Prasinococcus_capsulatus_cf.AAC.3